MPQRSPASSAATEPAPTTPPHANTATASAGAARTDYAVELERATRGLLAVTIAAIGHMEATITATHLRALQALDRLGPCKVFELADALDLTSSSASRLSDRLAEDQLITRAAAPDNRRATLLELTPRGRATVEQVVGIRAQAIERITNLMSARDRRALLRGAQAFTEARLTLLRHAQPDDPLASDVV